MLYKRDIYLNRLIDYKDTEFIKIITGVRRSGKSFVLKLFMNYLIENGIDDSQIIYVNFEHPDFQSIINADRFYEYLLLLTEKDQKYYFLFDEVQDVMGWQKTINGLRVKYDCDIYITGSNASMLSGELASYLSGRYVEIKVLPLSFKEFLDFKTYSEDSKIDRYFEEYMQIGSFPSVVLLNNANLVDDVLLGIYDSILLKDVSLRGKIKDIQLLRRIVEFIFDNTGKPVSSNSIAKSLTVHGIKTRNETVEVYLNLLENAFMVYKAQRFNIRGKEILKGQSKYYCIDNGLRNVVLGRNRGNFGLALENVVFLELIRRGYEVSVGKFDQYEVDFVCTKVQDTCYIQVAYDIPKNSSRETDNLLKISDAYKKIVITANRMNVGTINGIEIIYITDFLLNRNITKDN